MFFKKLLPRATLLAVILLIGACASVPGPLNGFGDDSLSKTVIGCSDGACSVDQVAIAAVAANLAGEQVDTQLSSPLESVVTTGLAYGAAYVPIGHSQEWVYLGADGGAAAVVSAMSGLMGGIVNGAISWSYANANATGAFSEMFLRDWERGVGIPPKLREWFPDVQKIVAGLHMTPATVRSKNETPAHVKGAPWSGPLAGTRASAHSEP